MNKFKLLYSFIIFLAFLLLNINSFIDLSLTTGCNSGLQAAVGKIFILYFKEETETEIFNKLKFNLNFNQALFFAKSSLELVSKGRPLCKLCYQPMNKNDKSESNPNICINCPRKNGHYKQKN